MRALVRVGPGPHRLEVLDILTPEPAPDEVVVRVAECGICGTDVSLYEGALAFTTDGNGTSPVVIGHEFTGMVAACGAAVRSVREGDWVVVNPHLFCGRCPACLRGEEEICENRPLLSWDRPGGAAEYVAVRASNAYRLDRAVAVSVGALAEPLAVAVHAVRRIEPHPGERLAVVGSGPLGILASFVAAEAGLDTTLIGLASDGARLAAAERLGVHTAVQRDAGTPVALGHADVALEAAGTERALLDAVSFVRKGGRIGLLGLPHHPVPIDIPDIVFAEKTLIGIRGYAPRDWERTVQLLDAHLDKLRALITHGFDLVEIEAAMGTVEGRKAVKVVLRPGGTWYEPPQRPDEDDRSSPAGTGERCSL